MATTQPRSTPATSEQALRDRIHRLFSEDAPLLDVADTPHFWVPPTEAQAESVVPQVQGGVERRDEVEGLSGEERLWLESPHVMFDGRSPEQLLTGDRHCRERIERFLSDVEEALAGGAFR